MARASSRFRCRRKRAARKELIFPTLAELCGLGSVKGLAGRSFAPLLEGKRYQARKFAYSEYYFCRSVFTRDNRYVGKPPMLMVRTGRWKLVPTAIARRMYAS